MSILKKILLVTVLIVIGILIMGRRSVVQITCRQRESGLPIL